MSGSYNTSVFPLLLLLVYTLLLLLCPCIPHVVIVVPHRSPLLLLVCPIKSKYCYCCALTLLLLGRLGL